MSARIMIGADLVPTKSNEQYFKNGDVETLVGSELLKELNQADFTIFNLEVPLTNQKRPIEKCGPNLITPTETINGLKKINPCFFTLANNHILDQGKQGLDSTMAILDRAEIAYAGAGMNLQEAQKPYVITVQGIKIGIYCCAEHEFTIATEATSGANPFDALESLDHVARLKETCDFVITLYHGGKEHYRYPSPYLQKVCRRLVEKGADLVVCQHSHCIGAQEEWKGGRIIYGQGNFLFDDSDSEYWQTSLLINLILENDNGRITSDIHFCPLVKCENKVRIADKEKKDQILSEFEARSKRILAPKAVEDEYSKFAESMVANYLNAFSGAGNRSLWFRAVNKLSGRRYSAWLMRRRYGKQERNALWNFIECEAHRELVLKGLRGDRK